jgi:hypothetical protein
MRGPESSSENVIIQPFILWPRPSNGAAAAQRIAAETEAESVRVPVEANGRRDE